MAGAFGAAGLLAAAAVVQARAELAANRAVRLTGTPGGGDTQT